MSREIRREALFLCITPLPAALLILDMRAFKAGSSSFDFFCETSELNLFTCVLKSLRTDWFRSHLFLSDLILFKGDLSIGIVYLLGFLGESV